MTLYKSQFFTHCRNISPIHGPLNCETLNGTFLSFFNHTVYTSIWQFHGNIPCEAPFGFYLWLQDSYLPSWHLLKLLKTCLPSFIERSIFRIIFFYLSRTYFHRKSDFKCTQQLCEHRQHMQEFPQSHPLQPQLDQFLQKKYSWAHRTWWAQKWFHVSFNLTFSWNHLSHNAH